MTPRAIAGLKRSYKVETDEQLIIAQAEHISQLLHRIDELDPQNAELRIIQSKQHQEGGDAQGGS